MVCDLHVHTRFSCDSNEELENVCVKAIEKGVDVLCITDHVDFDPNDSGYGFYDADGFFSAYNNARERHSSEIQLLCGIEFSEPHLYAKQLAQYSRLPYDFILGSVHYWYQPMRMRQMVETVPVEVSYSHYWQAVYRMVQAGGFDSVGHFDFPKRYYKIAPSDAEIIPEIFREMVKNDICLEINTSSLRKNAPGSMPDKDLLLKYKACGGKYVTVGSDAHRAEDLAADNEYAKALIGLLGLKEVYFSGRRRIELC